MSPFPNVVPAKAGTYTPFPRGHGVWVPAFAGTTIVAAALALALPAHADYPARPIKGIVALSPGGTSDVFIRALGEELRKRWGQPLIVENRPGGNTNIGGKACAEAANDGYTICILPGETLAFNQFQYKKLPYNAAQDFVPIMGLFFSLSALVVNSELKVKSIEELVALTKAKPKTLSYMAPSVPLALFMEKLNAARGIDIVRVPFRGGGDAANAILSGSTPVAFVGISNFVSHLQAGTMTALAVDHTARVPLLPDVPTLIELGYPDNPTRAFFGLVAPAGTPPPIIQKIRDEAARIIAEPEFRKRHMIDRGLAPIADTPEAFARFVANYRAAAERVVKEAGLEPQ
jgi:tripartite-type tricarboxylate transporter receptor subunit TctC